MQPYQSHEGEAGVLLNEHVGQLVVLCCQYRDCVSSLIFSQNWSVRSMFHHRLFVQSAIICVGHFLPDGILEVVSLGSQQVAPHSQSLLPMLILP